MIPITLDIFFDIWLIWLLQDRSEFNIKPKKNKLCCSFNFTVIYHKLSVYHFSLSSMKDLELVLFLTFNDNMFDESQ